MNQVARTNPADAPVPVSESDIIRTLQSSLYPGAKDDSVRMVISWCLATGRDPMKKPVHIVPMSVKIGENKWEMRDVLMPGIGTYRSDAAATGQYCGKGEPEFGPEVTRKLGDVMVTYPEWCRITIQRLVGGAVRNFTAKEYWTENYATAGRTTEAPNAMWKKRPRGQLAKCAESQALRMAFPDETGNTNTAEEMEGKSFTGNTVDITPQPAQIGQDGSNARRDPEPTKRERTADRMAGAGIPSMDDPPDDFMPGRPAEPRRSVREVLRDALFVAPTRDEVAAAAAIPAVAKILRDGPAAQKTVLQDMIDAAWQRFEHPDDDDAQEPEGPDNPGTA